jgi:hypothetical protein
VRGPHPGIVLNEHYESDGQSRSSTKWPTTQASESILALPPQMGTMLIWSVFSGVTRPLLSHRLVIGKHPKIRWYKRRTKLSQLRA